MFQNIFLRANREICSKKIYFNFRYKDEYYKILTEDILYFESRGRQIMLYHSNGDVYYFNSKLNEVEINLENGKIPFLRIHQSYLVNYHYILLKTKKYIELENHTRLRISEEREKEFRCKYNLLVKGKVEGKNQKVLII